PALESIAEAERLVITSAEAWNSTSIRAIEFCETSLEASAAVLREAVASIGGAEPEDENAARPRVRGQDFRENVINLERQVATSAAFLRGAPGSAHITDEYQPGGELRVLTASESAGIQA